MLQALPVQEYSASLLLTQTDSHPTVGAPVALQLPYSEMSQRHPANNGSYTEQKRTLLLLSDIAFLQETVLKESSGTIRTHRKDVPCIMKKGKDHILYHARTEHLN